MATSFDENGNAVTLLPCAKQDKVCQKKRSEFLKQKKLELNVQNGTLSIDGFIGKTKLNYDAKSLEYLYIAIPDTGIMLISSDRFPNSTEVKDALDHQTMLITTTDNHQIKLTSDTPISGRQKRSLFYRIDSTYQLPGHRPAVGYGFVSKAPYAWPGAQPAADDQHRRVARVVSTTGAAQTVAGSTAPVNTAPRTDPIVAPANTTLAENRQQ